MAPARNCSPRRRRYREATSRQTSSEAANDTIAGRAGIEGNRGDRYIAEVDGDELFVAESRVESAVGSVLVLDGGLPIAEIGEREEAGNEFGVEGTIPMLGEEQLREK